MSTATIVFGTPTTIGTFGLASLANSATAGRASPLIDNTGTLAVDYILGGSIRTGTSPTANNLIIVRGYELVDGTSYLGGASGSDSALTPTWESEMPLIAALQVSSTNNLDYRWSCRVGQLFGGVPMKFGVWIRNTSGVALNASGHTCFYTSIKYASA